jgi:hypothetical protein
MIMCTACGHQNPTDSSFCRACGKSLEPSSTVKPDIETTGVQPRLPHAPPPLNFESGRPRPPAAPPPPWPQRRTGPSPWLILPLVLVLAAAGVGGVLLARRSSHSTPTRPAVAAQLTTTVNEPALPSSTAGTGESGDTQATSAAAAPSTSEPQVNSGTANPYSEVPQMEAVLREFHEDVLAGNFQGAWELTSFRYRKEKEDESGGYASWVSDQKSLQHHLQVAGLKLSIDGWESQPQVATVRVTGMRWSEAHSSCTYFQGITWMRHEGTAWYYEPGYSVSPERRAQWEGRKPQLLGWGCAA